MAEYISREITLDAIRELSQRYNDESLAMFAYDIVTKIPNADVQPVKRGKWIEKTEYGGWGDTSYTCSECETTEYIKSSFCPWCGADLRRWENG